VARPVATLPSKSTSALAPRWAERCTAVRECLKTRCRAYRSKIKKILASHKILKPRTYGKPTNNTTSLVSNTIRSVILTQACTKLLDNSFHTSFKTADCYLHTCFNVTFITLQPIWVPPAPIQGIIYNI
jgi:hypothetical protein